MHFRIFFSYLVLSLVLIPFSVRAQSGIDRVEIHGFGGWAYAKTDHNNYLMGDPDGRWDYWDFALNFNTWVTDNLRVNAQLYAEGGLMVAKTQENTSEDETSVEDETSTNVDYAFVEYTFSDLLKLRAGKVKHPFGIYGEVLKAGTVRPFFFLPTTIYGRMGIVANGYKGVGVLGRFDMENGWALSYDIYGGEVDVEVLHTWHALEDEQIFHSMKTKDVIGGRLVIETPIEGLNLGASGYTGTFTMEGTKSHQNVYGFHVEYATDRFGLRSEWAQTKLGKNKKIQGLYVEGDYLLTDHWQAALCYEWSKVTLKNVDIDLSEAPSLGKHRAWDFGLNYIVTPNLLLRASYHIIKGNRFAYPDDLSSTNVGTLNDRTHMYLFGFNFSF